jgi:hypothetical protein
MTLIRIPDLLRDLEILKTNEDHLWGKILRELVLRVVKTRKKAASTYHRLPQNATKNRTAHTLHDSTRRDKTPINPENPVIL